MTKKLFILFPMLSLLFVGCANTTNISKEESKLDSESTDCCSSSESNTESSISSEQGPQPFDVRFYVNTQTFQSWSPSVSGYFIHAWNASGGLDKWGDALMSEGSSNLYSYTYHLEAGSSITGVVFAFKQGSDTKQTVDMACNITEAGNYLIQYDGSDWQEVETNVWKMNASIIPYNG